jgi:hypothetical protein
MPFASFPCHVPTTRSGFKVALLVSAALAADVHAKIKAPKIAILFIIDSFRPVADAVEPPQVVPAAHERGYGVARPSGPWLLREAGTAPP